jgi:hypothetical protein
VERPLDSLAADAMQGEVADGKLLTLIMALQLRRPDLFIGRIILSSDPRIPTIERPPL